MKNNSDNSLHPLDNIDFKNNNTKTTTIMYCPAQVINGYNITVLIVFFYTKDSWIKNNATCDIRRTTGFDYLAVKCLCGYNESQTNNRKSYPGSRIVLFRAI